MSYQPMNPTMTTENVPHTAQLSYIKVAHGDISRTKEYCFEGMNIYVDVDDHNRVIGIELVQ